MSDITNYNSDGLCVEKYCDKKYTKFRYIKLFEMDLVLGFCEEHFIDMINLDRGEFLNE